MRPGSVSCKRTKHVSKSPFSTISVRSSSANGAKRSQRKTDSNWSAVLNQISIVTDKVKKMVEVEEKCAQLVTNAHTVRNVYQRKALTSLKNYMDGCSHINLEELADHDYKNYANQNLNSMRTLDPYDLNRCSPNCHSLMNECVKLSRNNSELKDKNEKLERQLYLQERKTNELLKKLEREMSKDKNLNAKANESLLNISNPSLENRLKTSCHLSASTAKRESSIRDIQAHKKSKAKKEEKSMVFREDNKSDSLLIDMENNELERRDKTGSLASKTYQSISLSRDLENLLEICKNEQDNKKKRIIRKQMQNIAQQIQSLQLHQ